MFKRRLLYFLLLLGAYIFYLFYKMWVGWYILVLVILIPVLSCIFSLILFFTIKIKPSLKRVALINEEVYISLGDAQNNVGAILPVYAKAKIKDFMADKEYKIKIRSSFSKVDHYVFNTEHCGIFEVTIPKVYVYDILGLFRFRRKVDFSTRITIKPRPVLPERMPELAGFKAKYLRKSNRLDSEIYDIREYMEGDPIKTIHWKVSAKKDKTLVKEPQEEHNAHSRVYLELSSDRDIVDKRLGELIFTSRYFLDNEMEHKIRVVPPYIHEISFDISNNHDIDRMLQKVLLMKLPDKDMDKNLLDRNSAISGDVKGDATGDFKGEANGETKGDSKGEAINDPDPDMDLDTKEDDVYAR